MADPIQVAGLRDFNRELRKLDRTFPREIRRINLRVAQQVAAKARSNAEGWGGAIGKASTSIKALAQQSRAQVRIGGERYPYALGGEFGSKRFKQFDPWRGSGPEAGYALYPAIREESPEIIASYSRMVADATRAAFPR